MLRVKISVPTQVLELDIRRGLHWALQIGAQGVQFDLRNEITPEEFGETARRQLLHELSERGLQAASGHFPLRSGLTAPERLDERLAALHGAIEFAAQLKMHLVTLPLGRLPPETDRTGRALLASVLSELASQGNRRGVTIGLVSAGDPNQDLIPVLESIKTGPICLDADLAAWALNGQSVPQQLRELQRWVGHVEARDAIRDVGGRGREAPIGRGEIDWDETAALLNEMDYRGWMNVTRSEGTDQAGDVERGVQYLKNVLPS